MTYNKNDRVYIATIGKYATVHHQPRANAEHVSVVIDGNSRSQYMPVSELSPAKPNEQSPATPAESPENDDQAKPRAGRRPRQAKPQPEATEPTFEEIIAHRRKIGTAVEAFDNGVRKLYRDLIAS